MPRIALGNNYTLYYRWKDAIEHERMIAWCDQNDIDFGFNLYGIWVPDHEDQVLFKLRWDGCQTA